MNRTQGSHGQPRRYARAVQLPCELEARGVDETMEIAGRLAERLCAGDIIWISGDLGAGKTAFVRGACRALGVVETVTSPTFTIAQRYSAGEFEISHLDLYRLAEGLAGEVPGLLEEETGPDRVTFVEWPARTDDPLLRGSYSVQLDHAGGDLRRIRIA